MSRSGTNRLDPRLKAQLLTLAVILLLGGAFKYLPGDWTLSYRPAAEPALTAPPPAVPEKVFPIPAAPEARIDRRRWWPPQEAQPAGGDLPGHVSRQVDSELSILFEHGVALLQQGEYTQAVRAMEMVLKLAPRLADARVNLGFARLGLKEYRRALVDFEAATDLNPMQANAYYGAAICYEAQGQLPEAIGSMRSYLHLGSGRGHYAAKARSALWEWEQQLAKRRGSATLGASDNSVERIRD